VIERGLRVEAVANQLDDELEVGLRLDKAPHHAEGSDQLRSASEHPWDQGVIRAPARNHPPLHLEAGAPVLKDHAR
jgi:hypothetical protein